jgi:DNA-binding transcriptional regulator LsrR (DeoR family)
MFNNSAVMKKKQDLLNLLRKLQKEPNSSQGKSANSMRFSLAKLNCCLQSLKQKSLVRIHVFKKKLNKKNYTYVLAAKEILEKQILQLNK